MIQVTRKHYLKTWPDAWNAVASGAKTAEYRRDDRNFAVGDTLVIRFFDPSHNLSFSDTKEMGYAWQNSEKLSLDTPYVGHGNERDRDTNYDLEVEVTHIVRGPHFGIPAEYCLLSFVLKQVEVQPTTGEEE